MNLVGETQSMFTHDVASIPAKSENYIDYRCDIAVHNSLTSLARPQKSKKLFSLILRFRSLTQWS